jgi:putative ATP-dependent DNA ligase
LEIIAGYPKIRRAVVLGKALEKHMTGKFCVEEKLNGYNIRTFSISGKIACLTKGGIVCKYTGEHVEKLINKKFFDENTNLMLCGEVIGLQNPYQMKSYPEAAEFGYFVFDIRKKRTGEPMPVDERKKMIEKYTLPNAHSFGIFTPADGKVLLNLVRKLGSEGREGIVLKDLGMKTQMKYTANQSTNEDLKYAFNFFFDYGQPFFFRRLIREAFQCYELGLDGKVLEKEASELGKSILIPMVETIKKIAEGKEVTEDFDIAVPSEEFGKMFIEHLRHLGVKATIERIDKNSNGIVIKVKRHYPTTNDKIKAYLGGEFCQE